MKFEITAASCHESICPIRNEEIAKKYKMTKRGEGFFIEVNTLEEIVQLSYDVNDAVILHGDTIKILDGWLH
jgi:hypothetical protein